MTNRWVPAGGVRRRDDHDRESAVPTIVRRV
jgi:hypothetical protein